MTRAQPRLEHGSAPRPRPGPDARMPPLRPTRRADGAAGHDGEQGAGVRPAAAGVAGGLDPPDRFYRQLESALDLAFVRDLVHGAYADIGRPSIDPVVFFKA